MSASSTCVLGVGDFTRKAVVSYEKWIVPEIGGERDGEHDDKKMCYYKAFTEMGLHITINQVTQLLNCTAKRQLFVLKGDGRPSGRDAGGGGKGGPSGRDASVGGGVVTDKVSMQDKLLVGGDMSLGEFCVVAAELYAQMKDCQSNKLNEKYKECVKNIYLTNLSTKSLETQCVYEVFLGGSCNPTVWRKEIAIPLLQEDGITYFNPQLDEWYPELIEIEEKAKKDASMLFFVIDNQTRAVSSMVETAFLMGRGRRMVVVLSDIVGESPSICGEPLSIRETMDLNRGRSFLRELADMHCFIVEPSVQQGVETIVKILKQRISSDEFGKKFSSQKTESRRIGDGLRLVRQVFTMYDTNRQQQLTQREACLALRSIQVLPDPLPSSLASIFLTPPSNDQWDRNGIDFESFCICYSELRYRCVQQNKDGWLSSLGSLVWAPVQWLKEWAWSSTPPAHPIPFSYPCDVFLGGSCGDTTWRTDTAIPFLRQHGASYFNPQILNWDPMLFPIENQAKSDCNILLFVVTGDTLSVSSLTEAAYYIGVRRRVVLCLQDINGDSSNFIIEGMKLTEKAIKDYNRARSYLSSIANKNRTPIFSNIAEAVMCCIYKLKGYQLHVTHEGPRKSLIGTTV